MRSKKYNLFQLYEQLCIYVSICDFFFWAKICQKNEKKNEGSLVWFKNPKDFKLNNQKKKIPTQSRRCLTFCD